MSDSSLSEAPPSELSLPVLPPTPFVPPQGLQLRCIPLSKTPELSKSDSILFSASLFSRTVLDTTPITIQLCCLQLLCKYTPKPQPLNFTITSNYWTHYKHSHPEIFALYNLKSAKESSSQASSSSASTFFMPQLSKPNTTPTEVFQAKYRALLLNFVVSNNLTLQVVDSQLHCRLIQDCNASILTISTLTLNRDLKKTFLAA
jgi:hypothetical protein